MVQNVVFLLSSALSAGTVLAQTLPDGPPPESAQVAEAFAELDELSDTIASRLRDLAQHTGLPAPPPDPEPTPPLPVPPPDSEPAPPPADPVLPKGSDGATGAPPSPPSETGEVDGTEIQEPCGTRQDMDLRIGDVEERFDGFRRIISAANDDLPTHRNDVRDINKVCTPQIKGNIDSAVNRLERLQIEPTFDVAVKLLACVDQRRRTIDGELNRPNITAIRTRILTDELVGRLSDMMNRVQKMELALLFAVSKRRRLVEELTQFRQEIASACAPA